MTITLTVYADNFKNAAHMHRYIGGCIAMVNEQYPAAEVVTAEHHTTGRNSFESMSQRVDVELLGELAQDVAEREEEE